MKYKINLSQHKSMYPVHILVNIIFIITHNIIVFIITLD
jgi:hypothetical protein